MKADRVLVLNPGVQGSDVREPHQRLVDLHSDQLWQQPHCAISAPGAKDAPDLRVAQRPQQLIQPPRIVPRQIAVVAEQPWVESRLVALGQQRQTGVE